MNILDLCGNYLDTVLQMVNIELSYYILGNIGLISTLVVVSAKNPIHRIAALVIVFTVGAFIFMLLDFYFLGLTYIIVYVGAIAILFLFVIMMVHLPSARRSLSTTAGINMLSSSVGLSPGLVVPMSPMPVADELLEHKHEHITCIRKLNSSLYKTHIDAAAAAPSNILSIRPVVLPHNYLDTLSVSRRRYIKTWTWYNALITLNRGLILSMIILSMILLPLFVTIISAESLFCSYFSNMNMYVHTSLTGISYISSDLLGGSPTELFAAYHGSANRGIIDIIMGDNALYSDILRCALHESYIYSYFFPIWSIEFKTITDISSLGMQIYVAYPTAIILIGLALWTVMVGIISICSPRL